MAPMRHHRCLVMGGMALSVTGDHDEQYQLACGKRLARAGKRRMRLPWNQLISDRH